MTVSAAGQSAKADLFGHPRALTFLFATEMWERFSFYGMRALLVLYMIKYLLLPPQAGAVLGLAWFKAALEAVFGPLELQPLSSQIYGFYTGLVYLTPIFGGLLADRVLGRRRTVVIGAGLMAVGHFMMAFEHLFLLALLFLIFGSGCFKPNISTQVGTLYPPGDPRRDRAFSIFYVGINLGAFLAPLVCGTLGETYGWDYGFGAAGIGMTIGLITYLVAAPTLPREELPEHGARPAMTRQDRRGIAALLMLFMPVSLFWAAYDQQGNTLVLWASDFTDRHVFGWEIPVTWFQAFNPLMIFAFTPFIVAFWRLQGPREPSTLAKLWIGSFLNAASWLILCAAALVLDGGQASWLWIFAFFVVITIGELYASPPSLSLVTKIAPPGLLSMMMGVWLSTYFVGGILAGYLGTFWLSMSKPGFFLMLAAISVVSGLLIMLLHRPLRDVLKD